MIRTPHRGDPYAIVTLSWTNSSDADIRLSPLTYVYVGAGGREANRVDYGDNPDEITPRPNETMTYDVAFLVSATDRDRVVLDVSDAMDPSHLVRFRGTLRLTRPARSRSRAGDSRTTSSIRPRPGRCRRTTGCPRGRRLRTRSTRSPSR